MAKQFTELEMAVLELPLKEKDKLLLRLLKKDKKLVAKLEYDLVEKLVDPFALESRRKEMSRIIEKVISPDNFYWISPMELLSVMRSLNARITEHVRVTGDKSGGAEMTLTMIDRVFDEFWEMLNAQGANCSNFSPYVVKRLQVTMNVIEKLHEDYRIEFRDLVNKVLGHIRQHAPSLNQARYFGLSVKHFE